MAVLQVLNGLNPGQQFPLDRDKSVLGRSPECDVVLDVGAVSRFHAQITRTGPDYFIEDLKSRNGTFVNGEMIQGRRQLKDRDQLKICDLVFSFHQVVPSKKPGQMPGVPGTVILEDSEMTTSSTIMSKLDVSSSGSGLRVTVNPEMKLRAMLEITRNLASSLVLDEVLPKILDSLFKVFIQADRGFVVLRESADGPLIPKAVKYRRSEGDDTIRISKTVVNQAMNTKEALLSADAATDARFQMSESIADFRIRSMMCVPLIDSNGRALGVIQIDTLDQRSRFQQDDLDVLAAVAMQAAFAVENAQLHESVVKQKAYEKDLALAHRVQQGLLPSEPPKLADYAFFDFYEPANQVGGDYYDYIELADGRVGVIVADVSGKGIPAALLMAKVSADARYSLASERTAAAAVSRLNQSFARRGWEDRFVTLVLGLIDPTRHTVTVVNAGHMAPYLRDAGGKVREIGEEQAGVPLGVDAEFLYDEFTCELAPGESLTMFTDGISEAMNSKQDLYGLERIKEQVTKGTGNVAKLGQLILDDVKRFVGEQPQSDDMCLLCFGRNRGGKGKE
jgi:serine phosphatase RsbU (regulator of sigma subunit)/pSer/pThr/pTyr-binding forkhead associated (FHA) protein